MLWKLIGIALFDCSYGELYDDIPFILSGGSGNFAEKPQS
jgi:hypothetical protein